MHEGCYSSSHSAAVVGEIHMAKHVFTASAALFRGGGLSHSPPRLKETFPTDVSYRDISSSLYSGMTRGKHSKGGGCSRWMGPESSFLHNSDNTQKFLAIFKIGRRRRVSRKRDNVDIFWPGGLNELQQRKFHHQHQCTASSTLVSSASHLWRSFINIFTSLLPFLFCRCLPPPPSLLLWAARMNLHDGRSMLPRWVMLALMAESLVHYVL